MSFEEPNDPGSSEIVNNQIHLTELATYEERAPWLSVGLLFSFWIGPKELNYKCEQTLQFHAHYNAAANNKNSWSSLSLM